MATKKQKREAGEMRQKIYAEESRNIGLTALEQDRRARARRREAIAKEAEETNRRYNAILAMHGIAKVER